MWGKIMIPMYKLWLHGLYGLHGLMSPKGPLTLITHSLTLKGLKGELWGIFSEYHEGMDIF